MLATDPARCIQWSVEAGARAPLEHPFAAQVELLEVLDAWIGEQRNPIACSVLRFGKIRGPTKPWP